MIHANQRSRLGQAISLDHSKSEPPPKFFALRIERSPSRDERPEVPTKLLMNPAKDDPPAQKMFTLCNDEILLECCPLSAVFQVALHLLLQRLQDSRNAHQHRNMFTLDRIQDFRGLEFVLKDHSSTQQRRQEHPKKLAEDVAERKQIQKPYGMNEAFVLQILLHLTFERRDIRQHVAVSNYHSLGIGGRTRCKNDLQCVAALERETGRRHRMRLTCPRYVFESEMWDEGSGGPLPMLARRH